MNLRKIFRIKEIPYDILPADLVSLTVCNAWIVEIDCARLPKSLIELNAGECPFLVRILNLDQLPNLTNLYLPGCNSLRSLSPLPNSLKDLSVWSCPGLTSLPPLRRTSLEYLNVCDTVLRTLPELPDTIREIRANYSKLETLPFLPDSLVLIATLGISPTESIPACPVGVYLEEYVDSLRTKQRKALRKSRYDALFEELMMATWRPDRVSKWLDQGEDVLDMMMGC